MLRKYWTYIVPILGGMFYATGFPMFGDHTFILGPVLGFIFLNWSLGQKESYKSQLAIGWLFSLGFYSLGFYWIPFLLKEFGGLYPPFNYLLGIIFSFFIIPQVYFYIILKRYCRSVISLAFLYALIEYFIPQQFPAHLGHSFISLAPTLPLNLASVFGAPIYTFIVCIISLSILQHVQFKKFPWIYYLTVIILIVASSIPLDFQKATKENSINVRIVQPNIGNFLKIDSERGSSNSMKSVLESYYHLSTAPSLAPLDLIIWPETAYPQLLSSKQLLQTEDLNTPLLIKDIIKKTESEMLIGGYDINSDLISTFGFESEYNTVFYFSKESKLKDFYHKMKLIPFGEGLPFGPFNQFLSKYITNVSFFAAGTRPTVFKMPNGITFSTAICYEILFPNFIRNLLNGNKTESDLIINLTNDSWYGDTFEPYQHLFLTKWRALEFNLPIIRSTNTGITTVIYPDGSESKRMLINETKFMDIGLKISKHKKTIYQSFGILSFLLFGLILNFLEKILLSRDRVSE